MASKKAPPTPTPVDIATLHDAHPRISAQDWRSPLVRRLSGKDKYADGSSTISESFRDQALQKVDGLLSLRWKGLQKDFEQRIKTYQDPVITEHAALALACVLLTRHTSLRIYEVCRRGEAVDYWIGDVAKGKRFVLEVGGQQGGSLEALSTEKTQQLTRNPWGRAGFICVAVFDDASARLWFCTHEITS